MSKIDFNNLNLGLEKIDPERIKRESRFIKVEVRQLDENPENNNIYDFDSEADELLREDIEKNGILNPIIIIKSENHAGRYTIISGHRRTRIAKELGIYELDAREIIATTPEELALVKIMLITTNSTQRDRKPTEKAKEVQYLKELAKDISIPNVAKWISKITQMSERNVHRYDNLAQQPEEVQEAVDRGELSVKDAIGEDDKRKSKYQDSCDTASKIAYKILKLSENIERLYQDEFDLIDEQTKEYIAESIDILSTII